VKIPYAAIFWDNDGVLMETEHLYFLANREALAAAGVDLSLETFREISLQRGESVLQLAGSREDEARTFRDERYMYLLATESKVMTGVSRLLARLHGRVPMAIVTSCRRVHFDAMHRRSGLDGYFDFVLTREDYDRSKPDPEPYLTASARAAVTPERCLAIEDSVRGVTAAVRAGMTVAAIPGELNLGGNFSAARWTIDGMEELSSLLDLD